MPLSRSLHTDPYPIRAARRAGVPVRVRRCPPRPGFTHPAGPADVVRVLSFFGAAVTYGLRAIELRQRPAADTGLAVAALRVPGIVLLFEQPVSPWVLPGRLTDGTAARLERAGARVTGGQAGTRVDWPGDTLRDFMLFDGLMHEIGHHMIQHAARKYRAPAMRTADHERRADAYAMRARHAWAAR
ncbi:hypothetical protein [Phytohabitans aurantiacus]|jgi:hypothetical protein|uniref:Uncharacterized protein n=1 Tax=Phytohabitans aurantiacus TaxID=3016789 RepID=A0ABQ5QUF2_9ACTN|nr:hypothetical protein [Phytohabitans aurantiacus]GLH98133.1 hypothetical protein Pa4123_34080 [Phytohabitans aurantiacus]